MKIILKSTVLLACVGLYCAVNAGNLEITPTVAKHFGNKDLPLDDSKILYGVRATKFINNNIGIQGSVEASRNNNMSDGGKTDIERYSANVVYDFKNSSRVTPYASIGGGYEKTHRVNTLPNTDEDSQGFYNAAVGLKVAVTPKVNFVTEVQGLRKIENEDKDLVARVGVGMVLGGHDNKEPNPEVPNTLSLSEFSNICKAKGSTICKQKEPVPVIAERPMQVVQTEAPVQVVEAESATTVTDDNCVVALDQDEVMAPADIPEGYYVQIAALFKGNGTILTKKLERKNYPYTLYNTTRFGKDATLVLVGPYETKKEAKIAHKYLKRLSRQAFVKKFP